MSNQIESKRLNRLEINKETVRDLDVRNANEVRGGATVNQTQPTIIHCTVLVNEPDPATIIGGAPSYVRPRP